MTRPADVLHMQSAFREPTAKVPLYARWKPLSHVVHYVQH